MPDTPEKPRTYSERMLAVARRTLERKRQEAANKPASQPPRQPLTKSQPGGGG